MHSRWCVVAGFTQSGVKQDVQLRTSRGKEDDSRCRIVSDLSRHIWLCASSFLRYSTWNIVWEPPSTRKNMIRTDKKRKKKIASHLAYKTKQNKKKIYISFASDREKEDQNSSTLNKMVVEGKHCEHLKQEIINKAWVFSKKWLTNKSDSRTCGISSAWSVEQYNLKQLRLKLSTAVCWWERKTRQIPMVGRPSVSDWAAC